MGNQKRLVLLRKLDNLDFFHSLLFGKSREEGTKVDAHTVWCDANYTVVVQNADGPFGLIGFELSEDCLKVYQLQGIKGVNLRGLDLGDYLLACAEVIARKLRKTYIRVQPAYFHTYFELYEGHSLYPQLYKHQARLRKMYDSSSKNRGYEYCRPGYFFWYQKLLRKRLTFARWLQLQGLLFDRSMRKSHQEFQQDVLLANE